MQKTMPALYMLAKANEFVESEHPRATDGEFTDGSGAHNLASPQAAKSKVTRDKAMHSASPHLMPKAADGLPPSVSPEATHAYALGSKSNPTSAERQAEAKGNYAKLFTRKEKASLLQYAVGEEGDYAYINEDLREQEDEEPNKKSKYASEHWRHQSRLINQAIAHSPLPEDTVLWRGGYIPKDLHVGDLYCSPQLVSTTSSELMANMFASRQGEDYPILKIMAHKGDKAFDMEKGLPSKTDEGEFLFGSYQRFHVVSVGKDADSGRKVVTVSTRPSTAVAKRYDKSMSKSSGAPKGSKAFAERLTSDMGPPIRRGKRLKASMAKAQPTYGQYLSTLTQSQPSPEEQKYAWQQYQRLFEANHRHMEEARAEALARQMARGR